MNDEFKEFSHLEPYGERVSVFNTQKEAIFESRLLLAQKAEMCEEQAKREKIHSNKLGPSKQKVFCLFSRIKPKTKTRTHCPQRL